MMIRSVGVIRDVRGDSIARHNHDYYGVIGNASPRPWHHPPATAFTRCVDVVRVVAIVILCNCRKGEALPCHLM